MLRIGLLILACLPTVRRPDERVNVTVVRDGKKLSLTLPMQE